MLMVVETEVKMINKINVLNFLKFSRIFLLHLVTYVLPIARISTEKRVVGDARRSTTIYLYYFALISRVVYTLYNLM